MMFPNVIYERSCGMKENLENLKYISYADVEIFTSIIYSQVIGDIFCMSHSFLCCYILLRSGLKSLLISMD